METPFLYRISRFFNIVSSSSTHTKYHTLCAPPPMRSNSPIKIYLSKSRNKHTSDQATPIGPFYELLLQSSLSPADPAAPKLETKLPPLDLSQQTSSDAQKEQVLAKARVVFGSRLAGPAERRKVKDRESQVIAGILVPPKPGEPDNCCMSGCVNCVWDIYRDDMEEWAEAKRKADKATAKIKAQGKRVRSGTIADPENLKAGDGMREKEESAVRTAVSMDDDGGGSETNWGSVEEVDGNEDLFSDIPVGIREFMKQEKRLKEKHLREGTSGG